MAAKIDKYKVVKELSRPDIIFCMARVPGTQRVFLGSSDAKVYVGDLGAAKPTFKALEGHTSYVTGIALAGKVVVSGSYDGRLIWWDADKGTKVRAVDAHRKWVRRVAASPDGKTVASVADDMVCRLWDAATGKLLHELRGHKEQTPTHYPSMLFTCAFAPDGKHLATADKVGHIIVWSVATGKSVSTMEAPGMYTWDPVQRRHSIGGIRSVAFSPDGKRLAVGGIGKIGNIDHLEGKARVEVFDWQTGTRSHEFAGDNVKGLVEQLVFHPRGDWMLGAGGAGDGLVKFFDLAGKKLLRNEKVPMHVHDAALNEAGDTLYLVGHRRIQIVSLKG